MTTVGVVENKISQLRQYLDQVQKYQDCSEGEIMGDATLKGAIERYLYLAVQAAIDLAEAVISLRGLRKPTTYRESFEILYEEGYMSAELLSALVGMTGFRNVIAHDYAEVSVKKMCEIMHGNLGDIRDFMELVKIKLDI